MFRVISSMALLLWVAIACGPETPPADLKTDLDVAGNAEVRDRFWLYQQKTAHCDATGQGKRILITGFGLFSGADYNISGLVVRAFADKGLWPDSLRLEDLTFSPQDESERLGDLSAQPSDNHGAAIQQRSVTLDGVDFSVCLVHLDVFWDLAAAITVFEAGLFKPEAIVMMGRGGSQAILEVGAINDATRLAGYNSDGTSSSTNRPVRIIGEVTRILPLDDPAIGTEIAMTWDATALKQVADPFVEELIDDHLAIAVAPGPRTSNDYICNNLSFVVLNALRGNPLKLAGGTLVFDRGIDRPDYRQGNLLMPLGDLSMTRAAGFFHLPSGATDSKASVLGWARVVAAMVEVL